MTVQYVNEGQYVDYEVDGTRLFFGDDELMINCKKYQGDEERTIDIVKTRRNTLAVGADSGFMYIAQVVIPARQYDYKTVKNDDETETVERTAKNLNMDDVVLKLYAI